MTMIINLLAEKIHQNQKLINEFFSQKLSSKNFNFYNSIDIRHSGYKISAVDTNCFPAGFNNLDLYDIERAKKIADDYLKLFLNQAINHIVIIAENHTRNQNYFNNLLTLKKILTSQNHQVSIAVMENIEQPRIIEINQQESITINQIKINQLNKLEVNDKQVDLAILNNDLTSTLPEILKNTITPIMPSIKLGWYQRSKTHHFNIYNQLANEISEIIEIDPWLISSYHFGVDQLDFKNKNNLDFLAKRVDEILKLIQNKYQQYQINDQPYVFVKADNGTYGMGIWHVNSPDQILQINKKERNKMNVIKGNVINHKVIVQEGIKTIDQINQASCEPLIYLINSQVVANLARVNNHRDNIDNLNSSGASFINFNQENFNNNFTNPLDQNLLVYQFIARLACLASSLEF